LICVACWRVDPACGIALPDQLFNLIIEHRELQSQEREHAGTEWHGASNHAPRRTSDTNG
jgi:hypothetical protein